MLPMRDNQPTNRRQTSKIELLSQWKLEAESRNLRLYIWDFLFQTLYLRLCIQIRLIFLSMSTGINWSWSLKWKKFTSCISRVLVLSSSLQRSLFVNLEIQIPDPLCDKKRGTQFVACTSGQGPASECCLRKSFFLNAYNFGTRSPT